jgi:hypothetical protein
LRGTPPLTIGRRLDIQRLVGGGFRRIAEIEFFLKTDLQVESQRLDISGADELTCGYSRGADQSISEVVPVVDAGEIGRAPEVCHAEKIVTAIERDQTDRIVVIEFVTD